MNEDELRQLVEGLLQAEEYIRLARQALESEVRMIVAKREVARLE